MTPARPPASRLRLMGLAMGLSLLLFVVAPAAGQSPPGCSQSTLDADILFPPIQQVVTCGTTVQFMVSVANGGQVSSCDVTRLPVVFTCPDAATGEPTGAATTLAVADDFTADPPSFRTYPPVTCAIGNVSGDACSCDSAIGLYQVQLNAGPGRVELNPGGIDTIEIVKTASILCVTTTWDSTTTTTTSTTLISLNFQCYATKSQSAPPVGVTLVDRFGSSSVSMRRPERLCAPVDENGQSPDAPADPSHLVGYGLAQDRGQFRPRRSLRVANQFGTVTLDAVRFADLLVPSAQSPTEPPPPGAPGGVDHYLCYAVRSSQGALRFAPIDEGIVLVDQFGAKTVDVVRPKLLCNPVDVNGATPGAEQHASDLLCYQTRFDRENLRQAPVSMTDEFGQKSFSLIGREAFCVPSTVTE